MPISLTDRRRFARVLTNGRLPADIFHVEQNRLIKCESVDASRFGIGVITHEKIAVGELYEIRYKDSRVPLRCVTSHTDHRDPSLVRAGLMTVDESINIEELFAKTGCFPVGTAKSEHTDRSARHQPTKPLLVDASTFGVRKKYRLRTENISRSGILVLNDDNEKVPFRLSTILELGIDPVQGWIPESLMCSGKIVRMASLPNSVGTNFEAFGVALIDLTKPQAETWNGLIDAIEKLVGPETEET